MGCNWLHLLTFNNREWLRGLIFLIPRTWTRKFVNRLLSDTQGHASVPPFKVKAVLPAQENSHIMKRLLIWVLFLKRISSKMQYSSFDSILQLQLLWMQHKEVMKAGSGHGWEPAWFTWMAQQVVPLSGLASELHARGGICLVTYCVTDNQVVDVRSHAHYVLVSQPAESGTCPKCTTMPVPCCSGGCK